MNRNLLILGAGQYGTVVKEIAWAMGCFDKIDFLDDNYGKKNPQYHEEAIGKISDIGEFCAHYAYAVPAIGDADIRLGLIQKIAGETTYQIPVIVSPSAYVSPSAQLQRGAVVEPLAGVHANSIIGEASIISMGAVVSHNSIVAEGCHIQTNAVIEAGVVVAPKTILSPCSVMEKRLFEFEKAVL